MKENKKEQALANFKKAQSHLNKVIEMTEDGRYCIDVMQQNLAVIGLLKSAHQMLMENHLNSCFISALASSSKTKKDSMINEILSVTKLFNK
jgi:CsoR family transcriptional regulator, copper-sensing transcriptional repressor